MKTSMRNIEREFTPKEAATVSGVSTTLQRDWRRRVVLPETRKDGWASFSLTDVIEMTVMKAFSDSGISLKVARDVARMAVLPTLAFIGTIDGAVVFEGEEPSDKIKALASANIVGGISNARFVTARLPLDEDGSHGLSRSENLESFANDLIDHDDAFHGLVVDLASLALRIFERSGGPLIRIVCENVTE